MAAAKILITGASGEVGHGLIRFLTQDPSQQIVAFDLLPAAQADAERAVQFITGDIVDPSVIAAIGREHTFDLIYHLAGILSTGAERNPVRAHEVNVQGSLNILNLAREQSIRRGAAVKVIFPSTIAVYGLHSAEERSARLQEEDHLFPRTVYGINKLYIEQLGSYYSEYFGRLSADDRNIRPDFRGVRFPGLLSAETVPTGGTSDYGPEMLHAAAQGKPYSCFVARETRLPFMAMPDAVRALIELSLAPRRSLTRHVYNVTAFSVSAETIAAEVKKYFPAANITFEPQPSRLAIVESWPGDVDDSEAQRDWAWRAQYGFESAFRDYLVPGVIARYGKTMAKAGNS